MAKKTKPRKSADSSDDEDDLVLENESINILSARTPSSLRKLREYGKTVYSKLQKEIKEFKAEEKKDSAAFYKELEGKVEELKKIIKEEEQKNEVKTAKAIEFAKDIYNKSTEKVKESLETLEALVKQNHVNTDLHNDPIEEKLKSIEQTTLERIAKIKNNALNNKKKRILWQSQSSDSVASLSLGSSCDLSDDTDDNEDNDISSSHKKKRKKASVSGGGCGDDDTDAELEEEEEEEEEEAPKSSNNKRKATTTATTPAKKTTTAAAAAASTGKKKKTTPRSTGKK